MRKRELRTLLVSLVAGLLGFGLPCASAEVILGVNPATANLVIDRVDYSVKAVPVLTRSFHRHEKDRGLFGPSWCSNLDVTLIGTESPTPKQIELRDCQRARILGGIPTKPVSRIFRKVLDAWVEADSASRVLRKPDGRWELTEEPFSIFRPDGKLESFVTSDHVRWFVRRDSVSNIEALDNLKQRPIQFHRNDAGDLDSILDGKGKKLRSYRIATMLELTSAGDLTESYDYDSEGNISRLSRSIRGLRPDVWRISYTTAEWVSTVLHPDGCTSKWLFGRSRSDPNAPAVAKESKSCKPETLGVGKPMAAAGQAPRADAPGRDKVVDTKLAAVTIRKPGLLGVGFEQAVVTVNSEGLPVLFEIAVPQAAARRLEIQREEVSGSVLSIRSGPVEVNFRKKSGSLEPRQLELLDEYEEWMSSWGSRESSFE